jgi:hypothetical protein
VAGGAAAERFHTSAEHLHAVEAEAATEPGSFADRVASRRIDLVKRLRDGIPPVDYLPGSLSGNTRLARARMTACTTQNRSVAHNRS